MRSKRSLTFRFTAEVSVELAAELRASIMAETVDVVAGSRVLLVRAITDGATATTNWERSITAVVDNLAERHGNRCGTVDSHEKTVEVNVERESVSNELRVWAVRRDAGT